MPLGFQPFVDSVSMPCCVMSVEKTEEGVCGEIRIISANSQYKKVMGPAYYDNMPYHELVPRDNKFEDFCFRCAILKQKMHAYVDTKALGCWTDQTLIPLASDREDIGYCQYIFEFTPIPEASRMAAVSATTAETVINACLKLIGNSDFHEAVGEAIDVILDLSGAIAARIMLIDHLKMEAVVFIDRLEERDWPTRDPEKDVITYELLSSWEKAIGVSNNLIIKDEADMDRLGQTHPEWVSTMRKHGVKTMVLIPLRRDNTVIGYLYVVNFNTEKVVEVKEVLELMSFFLGSEIYNHLLLQRLEQLSMVDALTGINNRRAMTQCMDRLTMCHGELPYGIINIDLNGLKEVNDKEGHNAGDRLLVEAGEILKRHFCPEDLYRTGGDEFVVIKSGISREEFYEKIKAMREDMNAHPRVRFAIGEYWSEGRVDVLTAYRIADERMYANKRAYYSSHPELRRSR